MMNGIIFAIAFSAASSVVLASPVPQNPESFGCSLMAKSCRKFVQQTACTDEWKTAVAECIPASCTSTLTDILSTCDSSSENMPSLNRRESVGCKAMANSCKIQITEKPCTAEWQAKVESCIPTGCTETLKIALNACPALQEGQLSESVGCKAAAQSCRVYIQEKQCTPEWSKKVDACIPTGCATTLENIHALCQSEEKRSASSIGCTTVARACRVQVTAEPCSEEWTERIISCIPQSCSSILTEQLSQCQN